MQVRTTWQNVGLLSSGDVGRLSASESKIARSSVGPFNDDQSRFSPRDVESLRYIRVPKNLFKLNTIKANLRRRDENILLDDGEPSPHRFEEVIIPLYRASLTRLVSARPARVLLRKAVDRDLKFLFPKNCIMPGKGK